MTAASVRAYDALIRFAGFHYLPGSQHATLQRHEPGNARTLVRFTDNGDARIVRIGKGFRARHVMRCGSWLYAIDVERGVRSYTDDYLPGLQLAADDIAGCGPPHSFDVLADDAEVAA